MNNRLSSSFNKKGIVIEKWLVCPHTPEEECMCRKPKTGMMDSLKKDYYFDFKNSFVIGDRDSDLLLAKNLGAKSILIKRNEKYYNKVKTHPDFKAEDIYMACKFIKNLNKNLY